MTTTEVEKLGFEFIKCYPHDEWYTQRYQKGLITIKFTFLATNDKLQTVDVTIDEIVGKEVSIGELKSLDVILNKTI